MQKIFLHFAVDTEDGMQLIRKGNYYCVQFKFLSLNLLFSHRSTIF